MGIMDLPVFAALTDKMRWHQARQGLLAENVANADNPGFRGRDLKQYNFSDRVDQVKPPSVATFVTQPRHFSTSLGGNSNFADQKMVNFEVTPGGNGITLEDEMMKVTTNLMDYQAATNIYQKSVRILRTAMGKSA
ncbi:flagellar basal-body rod protein FlgB [Devosia sp. FJ2-5-3]|jgi:flagellar basal-body rod protein FlgB|uniref:flagellar basal-body rod protein FlgB n=1 Tax=Devosia sp. FJ2-5-3 TaxID=2976680 RepID=UPI0023D8732D|nr:flagellar basal-body rod protein FlgB [Devosia sp. FJ2-5-3]WEJ59986.1 flagellar basal-body rod protein FlgB [Devosia sp. FJ2-5-3]